MLSGTPMLKERWKRGVELVEGALGEAVGKIYVERHFSPVAKERMDELVANLLEAYRRSITDLDWMTDATKQRALDKLAKFRPQIGYPAKWRDYSSLEIDRNDLIGNVMRAASFEVSRAINKIGQPIDRDEWLLTPQTVNAYYHPLRNEIVFPAAILQPPFFSEHADDAANYGGIGAVIGHEIGHGFDDQGSTCDGDGALVNWWTTEDREAFEKRTRALIEQYGELEPVQTPGHKINGELTIGENIGDLGGLSIAYKAYRIAVGDDRPAPDRRLHRRAADLLVLGHDLAVEDPYRDAPAAAGDRPALPCRVPLQPDRPQHPRLLRRLRRHRHRRPLARRAPPRQDLVTRLPAPQRASHPPRRPRPFPLSHAGSSRARSLLSRCAGCNRRPAQGARGAWIPARVHGRTRASRRARDWRRLRRADGSCSVIHRLAGGLCSSTDLPARVPKSASSRTVSR